ncbi:MAG: hypothetical protein J5787_05620 [Alphaproteobacteria bacterium]|nr:hypothetical protein [Alphaproteobacteria bacterium]MBO4643587.1 hypothetical protein [Alphaproteobacteria bacterium]
MANSSEDQQVLQDAIEAAVMPVITSAATMLTVEAVTAAVKKLTATNYKRYDVTGDTNMKPSEKEVTINKSEASANETEGKLSKDGVSAQDGSIKASETEAKAATGEATAAESGAQALRTKAGASDIEVKALKIT